MYIETTNNNCIIWDFRGVIVLYYLIEQLRKRNYKQVYIIYLKSIYQNFTIAIYLYRHTIICAIIYTNI